MVSEQAKSGIDRIFTEAARRHLAIDDDADDVRIERLHGAAPADDAARFVVLTVTSYRFRLLTLFHVGREPELAAYFTRNNPERPFDEVFGEIGNLCCGAINRELGRHFAHTGMSTPFTLEGRCLGYLDELRPAYVAHHRIAINQDVVLHATQCLCAYAPLDFRVEAAPAAEETGVLEFF